MGLFFMLLPMGLTKKKANRDFLQISLYFGRIVFFMMSCLYMFRNQISSFNSSFDAEFKVDHFCFVRKILSNITFKIHHFLFFKQFYYYEKTIHDTMFSQVKGISIKLFIEWAIKGNNLKKQPPTSQIMNYHNI